jgi:hypothetical protein
MVIIKLTVLFLAGKNQCALWNRLTETCVEGQKGNDFLYVSTQATVKPLQAQGLHRNKAVIYVNTPQTVRFEILKVITMTLAGFWDVAPHSLVDRHQCSWGTCCLHLQGRRAYSSETVVSIYQTTQHQTPRSQQPSFLKLLKLQTAWHQKYAHPLDTGVLLDRGGKYFQSPYSYKQSFWIIYLWYICKLIPQRMLFWICCVMWKSIQR